ncbi:MAG: hypothetical protein V4792_09750 [Pseudomonadota bacterium]
MGIAIKQDGDGSMGLMGVDSGAGEFVTINVEYNAASVDKTSFVASRSYVVKSIIGRPTVIGSDGSAVTAIVKQAPSGTAITSGTALHSSTYNLKGTANTNQALTLSTTPTDLLIAAGSCIGVDFTGTLTAATGVITITLCPC